MRTRFNRTPNTIAYIRHHNSFYFTSFILKIILFHFLNFQIFEDLLTLLVTNIIFINYISYRNDKDIRYIKIRPHNQIII